MMMKQILASRILNIAKVLLAVEFPNQDAMKKYLKDHPDADRSKHRVVPVKGHPDGKVRTMDNRLNSWVRSLDDGKFYKSK